MIATILVLSVSLSVYAGGYRAKVSLHGCHAAMIEFLDSKVGVIMRAEYYSVTRGEVIEDAYNILRKWHGLAPHEIMVIESVPCHEP